MDKQDKHIRRSGDDYASAFAALLPTGLAWPRDVDATLMKVVSGLAQIFGLVDSRAADLLERETDPRITFELLSDWERNWGLPDPCMGQANTDEERRNRLIQRITLQGGQSRQFFIEVAMWLGYTIWIEEFSPIMGGVSYGGDWTWQAGPPEIRFLWVVHITGTSIWWFRGGVGEGGKDHHAEWPVLFDLECLINRYKPAHTNVIFDYAG